MSPFFSQEQETATTKTDLQRIEEKLDFLIRRVDQLMSQVHAEEVPTVPTAIYNALAVIDMPLRAGVLYRMVLKDRPLCTRQVFNETLRRMIGDGRVKATATTPEGRLYYLDRNRTTHLT